MTKEDQDEYLNLIESISYEKSGLSVFLLSHHPLYEKLMNEPTWAKFVFLSALYPNILDPSGQQIAFHKAMLSAFGSLQVDDLTENYRSYHDEPDRQETQESQQSMEKDGERCWAIRDGNISMSQQEMPVANQENEQISISAFENVLRDREIALEAREAAVAARESAVDRREAAIMTLEPIIREARDQVRDGADYIFAVWEFQEAGEWPNVWE
ncbi:hypothetical protein J3E69DRAFT_379982 [Trichoderma sp. SZMC 28015]